MDAPLHGDTSKSLPSKADIPEKSKADAAHHSSLSSIPGFQEMSNTEGEARLDATGSEFPARRPVQKPELTSTLNPAAKNAAQSHPSQPGNGDSSLNPAETIDNRISHQKNPPSSHPRIDSVSSVDILEVDSEHRDNSDVDSALGSFPASSTVSLRESVFDYVEENGRTYHALNAGKYIGPNDEKEQERLDLQHHLFVMTLDNQLSLAPLNNPQRVLDIATGTGIWAIEFAYQYPSASVLGTDLSPIQPTSVPPNCHFEIADAEEDWNFPRPFDYIHARAVVSCFQEPPSVINKIYENLAPGGWFEFQDPLMPLKSIDGTLDGTNLDQFQRDCMSAAEKMGRPWTNGKHYGRWMRERGFVDVVEKTYLWATNQWVKGKKEKLQALWLNENLREGLSAWGMSTLHRHYGWSREKIEAMIAMARKDLNNPNIHAYAEYYVVYGRKPL